MGPGLLIASPQMRDPNFTGTVVLVCHHDEGGALGVVVNRVTNIRVRDLLVQLDMTTDQPDEQLVLWGGPVDQSTGFVVFRGGVEDESGWNLPDHVAVSPSRQLLMSLVDGDTPYQLCLGYAGWGPGQLDEEIQTGSWLYTEIDARLLFDADMGDRYDKALATLGLRPEQIWMLPIDE